jgi:pimeloyl-ACP methyl ester carboxylesterase
MTLWRQEWGQGRPVIALHPLALESSVFQGLGRVLARRGLKTIAVDLPGFGRSLGPTGAHAPAELAEPILELARSLDEKPVLLGMSLGGRVALEAALVDPAAFRGVVLVAPYLPPLRRRWTEEMARWLDPSLAERIPLERAWPLLKRIANALEARPQFESDWFMRASARVAYYLSCPATRAHFVAAARDMALDPAFGPTGTWTRLEQLALPAAFVWGDRDWLIPRGHATAVAKLLPHAWHMRVPCSGHFMHGKHHRCFEKAMADAVSSVLREAPHARPRLRAATADVFTVARCFVDEPVAPARAARSVSR